MKRFLSPVALLAIVWSVIQLYWAFFGMLHVFTSRPLHLSFALGIVFLTKPFRKEGRVGPVDYVLTVIAMSIAVLYLWEWNFLNERIRDVDEVPTRYVYLGLAYILLTVEASRRYLGWGVTSVAVVALVYNFLGHLIPGALGHRFILLTEFIEFQILGVEGLLGVPLGVSAEVVFYFVLFSAALEVSGGGRMFIDLAIRLTGSFRGGPAKAAIVSSSLMGTISGSATANVVGTGIFTIPLMKRLGFAPHYAGAVEAVASTGGQLMPPIMGAGAFILADMTGTPYLRVAGAAAIPAIIYYVSLFFMVDLEAKKLNLKGLSKDEMPELRSILLERGLLLFPIILLLGYMVAGFTLMWSATSAAIGVVVLSWVRRGTRMGLEKIIEALEKAGTHDGPRCGSLRHRGRRGRRGGRYGHRSQVLGPHRQHLWRHDPARTGPHAHRLRHHGHGDAHRRRLHHGGNPPGTRALQARPPRSGGAHVHLLFRDSLHADAAGGALGLRRLGRCRFGPDRHGLEGVSALFGGISHSLRVRI